ncbi:MAG: hypothetical protein HY552_04060 [Elusimicrobia bacterium]|nr:hypothetical protein [Elusimicrobiota bacterium]
MNTAAPPRFRARGNGPVCLIGVTHDEVIGRVRDQLAKRGEPHFLFDQDRFPRDFHLEYGRTASGRVRGSLITPRCRYDISSIRSAYVRMLGTPPPDSSLETPDRRENERFIALDHLTRLWDVPTIGLTKPSASNFSKPYQISRIATPNISVPATLVTSRPPSVRAWEKQWGDVSFKSISSERSICLRLSPPWRRRLGCIRLLPAQFQEYIKGLDIRVHVVGRQVHALGINTTFSDYRYSYRYTGTKAPMRPLTLPREVRDDLVRISRNLGFVLSGIDLRRTERGEYFCFEVNPLPGFSFYDEGPNYPIANAVCDLLTGRTHV